MQIGMINLLRMIHHFLESCLDYGHHFLQYAHWIGDMGCDEYMGQLILKYILFGAIRVRTSSKNQIHKDATLRKGVIHELCSK